MAKKLSDIDLRNKRKAQSIYELSQDPAAKPGER